MLQTVRTAHLERFDHGKSALDEPVETIHQSARNGGKNPKTFLATVRRTSANKIKLHVAIDRMRVSKVRLEESSHLMPSTKKGRSLNGHKTYHQHLNRNGSSP